MSERKCFSKYEKKKNQYQKKAKKICSKKKKIRFMLPLDLKCKFCLVEIKKGKKLNAFKEKILNKNYLGINMFRFYFRCSVCYSGLSITTDLQEFKYEPEINCFKI